MHERANNVTVEGLTSEISNTVLTSSLASDATTIAVQDALSFHQIINNAPVSTSNPGYLKIGNEIIAYSAVSNTGQTITVATSGRGANETSAAEHASGSQVECYNLDGIPLTELNKTHTSISCPWSVSYTHLTLPTNYSV